jgi:hypothetical protein
MLSKRALFNQLKASTRAISAVAPSTKPEDIRTFEIYRYDPEKPWQKPHLQVRSKHYFFL